MDLASAFSPFSFRHTASARSFGLGLAFPSLPPKTERAPGPSDLASSFTPSFTHTERAPGPSDLASPFPSPLPSRTRRAPGPSDSASPFPSPLLSHTRRAPGPSDSASPFPPSFTRRASARSFGLGLAFLFFFAHLRFPLFSSFLRPLCSSLFFPAPLFVHGADRWAADGCGTRGGVRVRLLRGVREERGNYKSPLEHW